MPQAIVQINDRCIVVGEGISSSVRAVLRGDRCPVHPGITSICTAFYDEMAGLVFGGRCPRKIDYVSLQPLPGKGGVGERQGDVGGIAKIGTAVGISVDGAIIRIGTVCGGSYSIAGGEDVISYGSAIGLPGGGGPGRAGPRVGGRGGRHARREVAEEIR